VAPSVELCVKNQNCFVGAEYVFCVLLVIVEYIFCTVTVA